jgi:16S rRNA (adenine1518-N6/adenine1519-N6)-dimethyltransferase
VNSLSPVDAATLLKRYHFRPRHRLGQNFLQDATALHRITAEARIERRDSVLEIGCGFGSLTRHLSEVAETVIAVELDERLASIARSFLAGCPNVRIVCGDALALTPAELGLPAGYIVAANIPYYVTSPILRHLLESLPTPRRIVLTVQSEVAVRICAKPPDMSLLALSVQVYGSAEVVTRIPAAAFYPIPAVDSAVVRMEIYPSPRISPVLLPVFFRLARAGFGHKRKTLRNTIASGLKVAPATARQLLTNAGIDPQRRAETLSLDEWSILTEKEAVRPA